MLSLLLGAVVLAACAPTLGGMSCNDREGGIADYAEGERLADTPQLALAAFLPSEAAFQSLTRGMETIGTDTATWTFVDGQGTTAAEVKAERSEGGWAVVKWEYCRP